MVINVVGGDNNGGPAVVVAGVIAMTVYPVKYMKYSAVPL